MAEPILRSDLTEQQIKDAGRRIEMEANDIDDLTQFFEAEPFDEKKVDVKFRVRIPTRISMSEVDSYRAHENIAPANRTLKYASFTKTVQKFDTRHEYTRENVEENPDSVIIDATDDLNEWVTDMKKFSAALALLGAKSSVSCVTDASNHPIVGDTASKAFLILNSVLQSEGFYGKDYLAIAPAAVTLKLSDEIAAKNNGNTLGALGANKVAEVLKGYQFTWGNFSWFTPKGSNEYLQDASNFYVIFVGKDPKGRNPLRILKKKGAITELVHSPLGSGLLKNAKGEIVPDYNKQKGGIGCNMRGFLYYIRDFRYVLICSIPKANWTGISISSEIPDNGVDNGTAYKTLDRVIAGHGGTTSASHQALEVHAVPATGVTIAGTPEEATVAAVTTKIQLKANHDVVWYVATADAAKATVSIDGLVTFASTLAADTTAVIKAFDGISEVSYEVNLDVA